MFFINIFYNNVAFYLKSGVLTACTGSSTGSGTAKSTISADYVVYKKWMNVVMISIQFTVGSTAISEDAETIATGLPNAYNDSQAGIVRDASGNIRLIRVNTSGEIQTSYAGTLAKNTFYMGYIIYIST